MFEIRVSAHCLHVTADTLLLGNIAIPPVCHVRQPRQIQSSPLPSNLCVPKCPDRWRILQRRILLLADCLYSFLTRLDADSQHSLCWCSRVSCFRTRPADDARRDFAVGRTLKTGQRRACGERSERVAAPDGPFTPERARTRLNAKLLLQITEVTIRLQTAFHTVQVGVDTG